MDREAEPVTNLLSDSGGVEHEIHVKSRIPFECPISQLPEEVLTLILNDLRLSESEDNTNPNARLRIPRLVARVCSYWRFVALQNSLWWGFIYITPPWKFEQIRMDLERSRDCTLDMLISVRRHSASNNADKDSPRSSTDVSLEDFEKLGPILAPHFPRCSSLALDGMFRSAPGFLTSVMDSLMNVGMPHLQSFTSDCEFSSEDKDHPRLNLFASAPKLYDLRLGGMSMSSYKPPLRNITSLHLTRVTDNHPISPTELAELLISCQLLNLLAIYDDLLHKWDTWSFAPTSTATPDPTSAHKCSVPNLESLFILGNMLSVSELLLFLDAPKLRELVIAPVIGGDLTLLLSHVKEDRERGLRITHFPNLTKLTLAPAYSDAFHDTLPGASACFPQVDTLIFANVYYSEFVESFTDKSFILFPRLTNLGLTGVGNVDAPYFIRQVVDFRRKYHDALHRVVIDTESEKALEGIGYGTKTIDPEIWGPHARVEVEDLWEEQRRKAMYSQSKDLFVGRPSDEI